MARPPGIPDGSMAAVKVSVAVITAAARPITDRLSEMYNAQPQDGRTIALGPLGVGLTKRPQGKR